MSYDLRDIDFAKADRLTVESSYLSSGIKVADALIKTGAGVLHTVTISQGDAAPTAGTISILDSTEAGAGTPIFTWVLPGTTAIVPVTLTFDVEFSTGLFVDCTTVGDVNIVCSYR